MRNIAFVAAIAAAVPALAAAQPAAHPSDPSAPATARAYRSAFQDLPSGVEEEQLDWKNANADVARFARGHADYVQWEEQQQGAARAASAPGPAAAPAPAPAARPQGHQHH